MSFIDIHHPLRGLYYDLALSTSPSVFSKLKELVGASHILFGTDYPLRYEKGVAESVEQFCSYSGFDEGEKQKIMSEDAFQNLI